MASVADKYVALCGLASFLFGYQLAVLNTSIPFFTLMYKTCGNGYTYDCPVAQSYIPIVTSAVLVGAAAGSMTAAKITSALGPRFTLIVAHLLSVVGSIVAIFSNSYSILIVARFIVGLSVGLITVGSPTFISEICPNKTRGSRGVIHQLAITVGILFAIIPGLLLSQPPKHPASTYFVNPNTEYCVLGMIGFPAFLSVVALALYFTSYSFDSPLFLMRKNKTKAARDVLCQTRSSAEVEKWLEEFSVSKDTSTGMNSSVSVGQIFAQKHYLAPFIIGVVLSIGQQLSGINAFVAMSNNIFFDAGLSHDAASKASAAMALANVVMTFPAIFLIDSLGRKPLLIVGTAGQALCLAVVPILSALSYTEYLTKATVFSVVGFIIFFSIAQGPVLWVYLFEMYPPEIKSFCSSFASAFNWLAAISVVYLNGLFSSEKWLIPKMTLFASLCVAILIFLVIYVKETKGSIRSPYAVESSDEELEPLTA